MFLASPAMSATITVTANATDTLNGADAQCSLREAITNINNSAGSYNDCTPTGAYGTSDTINIPAGTYTISIAGSSEDLNVTGDYDIFKSVTITGAGATSTTINGDSLDRVFHITGAYTVSITGVTISGGNTPSNPYGGTSGFGGGICNYGTLTVTNSTISGNTQNGGGNGGGIYNSGTLTVTNTTISNNTASGSGGGIFVNSGTGTVTNSTISNNTANTGGNAGGGIFVNSGTVTVTNSTISNNTAPTGNGGGILTGHTATITNSTITGNTAGGFGGGIMIFGAVTITNSIVANQTAGGDCYGTLTSSGYNLESATTCGFTGTGDLQNADPLLGALASNGGLTQTMALQSGSPAIDAGSCVQTIDQRGYNRPAGATCDIGAYEYGATVMASYTVSATAGMSGSVTPSSQSVNYGSTASFTVTPNTNYTAFVGGTCSAGFWSGTTYTASAVTADCTVSFTFTLNSYTVSATAGTGGSVTPASQTVNHGSTTMFTVTPNTGYTASVGGTCGGTLVGSTYTTNAITVNCAVTATFPLNSYTVSATVGSGGTIAPASQTVNHGSTTTFTVTANTGYTTDTAVGGTCPAGLWSGTTYTTGAITGACTVSATFTLNSYTVSATAGAYGWISPANQTVNHGSTTTFTLLPSSGYTASVSGTCGGTLVGDTYTTNAITANCTVSATFTQDIYTVTATAGTGGSVTPSSRSVASGLTASFTVRADTGYTRATSEGGTCVGWWSGSTYTTGAITADCTVSFSFEKTNSTQTKPDADTNVATDITETSVMLNGSVNANNSLTLVKFQYGESTSYGSGSDYDLVDGNTFKSASAEVTGLTCGTTYHFRVWAKNSLGTTKGSDVTFTTSACTTPTATTGSVTNKTQTGVTFNGTVNPNNDTTTVKFQYGTTTSYGLATTSVTLSGTTDQAVTADVTGLTCETKYHFRVWANNFFGTTKGSDETFTTSSCQSPVVTTDEATSITQTGATLNGTVNPKKDTTTAWFKYWPVTSTSKKDSSSVTLTGNTDQAVTVDVTGLTCGTTYYFRVKAKNTSGTSNGSRETFTTSACADTDSNTAVSPVSDFDGDGKSDILFRDAGTGQTAVWMMNGAAVTSNTATSLTQDSGWSVQGIGDFDGDKKYDLLWRNVSSGELVVWTMNGSTVASSATVNANPGAYTVQGTGDFNGDGKSDILFRDAQTGETYVWFMDGASVASSGSTSSTAGVYTSTTGYQIHGVGDFNDDGKSDILWRNAETGKTYVWFMDGVTVTSSGSTTIQAGAYSSTTGWQIQGIGDFDGDGKSDILWRSAETGQIATWIMDGKTVTTSAYTSMDAGLYTSTTGSQVDAIGDYNGDGKSDILLRDAVTGQTRAWTMNGAVVTANTETDVNPGVYTSSTGWNVMSEETVR